jgi:hypothetical protein
MQDFKVLTVLTEFVAEFFTLICEDLHWGSMMANPVVENGLGHCGGFLVF